jgi:hypothetical protein
MALVYAVAVATFPDERIFMATDWLHGSTYLHGEDLIDNAKLNQIIEKTESSTGAQRWVPTLSLAKTRPDGRGLEGYRRPAR